MNIHLIMTLYALVDEPRCLFDRADADDIRWNIFVHSAIPEVNDFAQSLVREHRNISLARDASNPGLAHAWNTGLINAYERGADVVVIANDDAIPEPGMVQRIARIAYENPEYYQVMCRMLDKPSGQIVHSNFGLCALNRIAWDTIGCFDENFYPIYYEDVDFYYRANLAGLKALVLPDVGVTHLGSQTINRVPELETQNRETFRRNNEYYARKWGSLTIGQETYATPFNDPALGLKIDAKDRFAPYPGYDRTDREVVKL
jgi:GT2 family glycosyltransferase